jgi:hypothetical protein
MNDQQPKEKKLSLTGLPMWRMDEPLSWEDFQIRVKARREREAAEERQIEERFLRLNENQSAVPFTVPAKYQFY